jgi:hypothetical protein
MKTKIRILFVVLFLAGGFLASGNNFTFLEKNNSFEKIVLLGSFDQFNVIGTTKNEFGQNYTISLRITGTSIQGFGNTINSVEYNDGNKWIQVSYQSVLTEKGKYYVMVGGKTFYFNF